MSTCCFVCQVEGLVVVAARHRFSSARRCISVSRPALEGREPHVLGMFLVIGRVQASAGGWHTV
jgi:hypothetical protein